MQITIYMKKNASYQDSLNMEIVGTRANSDMEAMCTVILKMALLAGSKPVERWLLGLKALGRLHAVTAFAC